MQTRSRIHRIPSRRSQRGFGMAMAIAAMAVFAIIAGVIAISMKGGSQKTDLETAKGMANAIIDRGNQLQQAVTRVASDRDLTKMTLSATSVSGTSFGLYDPVIGVAKDVPVPGKALTTNTDASFALDKTNVKIVGLGSGGVDALAISAIIADVTPETCRLINKTLYNAEIDAAIPSVAATTAITTTEGCAVINSKNTYYKVLGAA